MQQSLAISVQRPNFTTTVDTALILSLSFLIYQGFLTCGPRTPKAYGFLFIIRIM